MSRPEYFPITVESLAENSKRLKQQSLEDMELFGELVGTLSASSLQSNQSVAKIVEMNTKQRRMMDAIRQNPWNFYSFLVTMRHLAATCPPRKDWDAWASKEALAYAALWGVALPCEFHDPKSIVAARTDHQNLQAMNGVLDSLRTITKDQVFALAPQATRLSQQLEEKYDRWKPREREPWAFMTPVENALTLISKRRATPAFEITDLEDDWPLHTPMVAVQRQDVIYVAIDILIATISRETRLLKPTSIFKDKFGSEPRLLRFFTRSSSVAASSDPEVKETWQKRQTRTLADIEADPLLRPCVRRALALFRKDGALSHDYSFFLRQSLFLMGIRPRELQVLLETHYRKPAPRDHGADIEDLVKAYIDGRHYSYSCYSVNTRKWCPLQGNKKLCQGPPHSNIPDSVRASIQRWAPVVVIGTGPSINAYMPSTLSKPSSPASSSPPS